MHERIGCMWLKNVFLTNIPITSKYEWAARTFFCIIEVNLLCWKSVFSDLSKNNSIYVKLLLLNCYNDLYSLTLDYYSYMSVYNLYLNYKLSKIL